MQFISDLMLSRTGISSVVFPGKVVTYLISSLSKGAEKTLYLDFKKMLQLVGLKSALHSFPKGGSKSP